jgi:hypothetical protein
MENDPAEGVRISAHADVTLRTTGSLTLTTNSRLESKTGSIRVSVSDDLVAYGTSLVGKSASLEAGGAIKGHPVPSPQPIAFDGALVLKAQAGIGGFGFERVFVQASDPDASVSAVNGPGGDVVIAAPDGLTVSSAGIRSESNGLVVLLTDTGTIHESGSVSAGSGRVVRMTGTTWISRSDAMATSLLVSLLGSDASPDREASSPLARMNQWLRAGLRTDNSSAPPGEGQLIVADVPSLSAVAQESLSPRAGSAAPLLGASMPLSPIPGATSTRELLEAAMRFAQQGRAPTVQDTESLSGWVNRIDREAPPPASLPERIPFSTDSPPANMAPVESSPQSPSDSQATPSRAPSESSRPLIEPGPDSAERAAAVRWFRPIDAIASWGQPVAGDDPARGQVQWADPSRDPAATGEPQAQN